MAMIENNAVIPVSDEDDIFGRKYTYYEFAKKQGGKQMKKEKH